METKAYIAKSLAQGHMAKVAELGFYPSLSLDARTQADVTVALLALVSSTVRDFSNTQSG